jgi:hypothetical protein
MNAATTSSLGADVVTESVVGCAVTRPRPDTAKLSVAVPTTSTAPDTVESCGGAVTTTAGASTSGTFPWSAMSCALDRPALVFVAVFVPDGPAVVRTTSGA